MGDLRQDPYFTGRTHRLIQGLLGLLLVASGLYVAFAVQLDLITVFGAALLLLFGGNALWASWRARRSWISRIGPLP